MPPGPVARKAQDLGRAAGHTCARRARLACQIVNNPFDTTTRADR
jgi:hypothetical protein